MSHNASTSNRTMRNKFGSTSTNESSQVPTDHNYRHTQTIMEGNGLERREISLICQYTRTRVLEALGTSWSANLQN